MGTKSLSLCLSGVNTNIFQKTVIAMSNFLHNGVLKYHNVQLGNIEVKGKRFKPPLKARLNEHNIVNFEHGIKKKKKCLKKMTQHR